MRFWLAFLMLLCLTACTQSAGTSNDDNRNRFGGFYGGVSGGGMGP